MTEGATAAMALLPSALTDCERGEAVLVFLHADSALPPGFADSVRRALAPDERRAPTPRWGAFEQLCIEGEGQAQRWLLGVVSHTASLRARLLCAPYGDQALFVTYAAFVTALGARFEGDFMEDVEAVRRLRRRCGRPAFAHGAVATSGRRFEELGVLRAVCLNQLIVVAWGLGVDTAVLKQCYTAARRLGGLR